MHNINGVLVFCVVVVVMCTTIGCIDDVIVIVWLK